MQSLELVRADVLLGATVAKVSSHQLISPHRSTAIEQDLHHQVMTFQRINHLQFRQYPARHALPARGVHPRHPGFKVRLRAAQIAARVQDVECLSRIYPELCVLLD